MAGKPRKLNPHARRKRKRWHSCWKLKTPSVILEQRHVLHVRSSAGTVENLCVENVFVMQRSVTASSPCTTTTTAATSPTCDTAADETIYSQNLCFVDEVSCIFVRFCSYGQQGIYFCTLVFSFIYLCIYLSVYLFIS